MTTYFYKHPRTFTLSVWLGMALATLLLSFFTSCAVHKTLSKSSLTLDSVRLIKEESIKLSRHDSLITREDSGSYYREITVEYDVHDTDVVNMGDTSALNFEPSKSTRILWNPTRSVRKITIRETGTSNTRQTGTFTNLDSTGSLKHDSTGLAKTVETVSKSTDVKPTIGLCVLYVVVGLAVLMGVGWVVRKFTV